MPSVLMLVLISFFSAKNQYLVRTLNHREESGHCGNRANTASLLASYFQAATAGVEPAFQGFEFGDFRRNVKILGITDIVQLRTFAHQEDLRFVSTFERGNPETERIPYVFRLVGLQNDAESHK